MHFIFVSLPFFMFLQISIWAISWKFMIITKYLEINTLISNQVIFARFTLGFTLRSGRLNQWFSPFRVTLTPHRNSLIMRAPSPKLSNRGPLKHNSGYTMKLEYLHSSFNYKFMAGRFTWEVRFSVQDSNRRITLQPVQSQSSQIT
jgi:hypothetical protein